MSNDEKRVVIREHGTVDSGPKTVVIRKPQTCERCGAELEQAGDYPLLYCPKCDLEIVDRGVLENCFNLCSDQGEIAVEGYGGEIDQVDVMIGNPGRHTLYTLTRAEVEELREYLTAWLAWRSKADS